MRGHFNPSTSLWRPALLLYVVFSACTSCGTHRVGSGAIATPRQRCGGQPPPATSSQVPCVDLEPTASVSYTLPFKPQLKVLFLDQDCKTQHDGPSISIANTILLLPVPLCSR
ncbi:hypothetical protein GALMADRAFT_934373 [Galerina marginata CBS 339.88]|uniref:Uncharacterized protein n=1 Tax=Galerina marginata (strain CBS 339.88) TaxID=685588 RepID=A0A067SGF4_GALM3|nr:hypothetical protein GALMADRAFT_934373 [Galerina marginata CBS 339.88]